MFLQIKSILAIFPRAFGICAVALLFGLAVQPSHAQVVYGSVVGTVTDQSDAVVPNATVTITSRDTGVTRTLQTDNGGRYSFVNVLPGRYDIKTTATGFRTFTQTDTDVSPNTVSRADFKLEVGQLTETVSVAATQAELQTEKADTHSEIVAQQIENLPLSGYRNYQTLINLVPGATPAAFQNSITDTPGRALQTHINGGNAQTNITRIDGATSVNIWLPHHVGYVEPEEAIDTVNITTTSADAEQGMAGSSAVTLITKSGTNLIHGSAYEFHDDQHLKARNYFQAAGTDKPLSIYNNFGATIGGPDPEEQAVLLPQLRWDAAAAGRSGILFGAYDRSPKRKFQRVSHRDLRPEHGQCGWYRADALRREYHSHEPAGCDRVEVTILLPRAEFGGHPE